MSFMYFMVNYQCVFGCPQRPENPVQNRVSHRRGQYPVQGRNKEAPAFAQVGRQHPDDIAEQGRPAEINEAGFVEGRQLPFPDQVVIAQKHAAQGRDQDPQRGHPLHHVIVGPADRDHETERTAEENEGTLPVEAEEVGPGHADRVGGIVVGRPDVQDHEHDPEPEQSLDLEHLGEVGNAVHVPPHRPEPEHEAVAEEEGDQPRPEGDPAAAGEAGPVGRLGAAAGEGPHDQGHRGREAELAGGEDMGNPSRGLPGVGEGLERHDRSQQQDQGDRDQGKRLHPLVSEIGGAGEGRRPDEAPEDHRLRVRPIESEPGDERFGHERHRHPEPAELGPPQDQVGPAGPPVAERVAGEEHRGQPGLRADGGEPRHVEAQDQAPAADDQKEPRPVAEGRADLRPGIHGRVEEGEAEQDHRDRDQSPPRRLRNRGERIIRVRPGRIPQKKCPEEFLNLFPPG